MNASRYECHGAVKTGVLAAAEGRWQRFLLWTLSVGITCLLYAAEARPGMVVATDFVSADGKADVADALQRLIDAHPNRTIYFPDGTYLLSHPLATPAHPKRSVDLRLSNYAVLKAASNWTEKAALVRLGGKDPANDIDTVGSNYGFTGGVLDGSDVADGISIDGGRETKIEDVSIKHVRIGVHVKYGANSGSSDADIRHVNIVGNGRPESVGLLVEGHDNTFANMRIANVRVGVDLHGAGNSLRNIHPLFTSWDKTDYETSVAFVDRAGNNWYDACYSDNFAVGFRTTWCGHSQFDSCYCMWYTPKGKTHRVIQADRRFESTFNDLTVSFADKSVSNAVLRVNEPGGRGTLNRIHGSLKTVSDKAHEPYLAK